MASFFKSVSSKANSAATSRSTKPRAAHKLAGDMGAYTNRTLTTLSTRMHEDVAQNARKEHRRKAQDQGLAEAPTRFGELMDSAIQSLVDQPWCFNVCVEREECQRICVPAEYATRGRNKTKKSAVRDRTNEDNTRGQERGSGAFGFDDPAKVGYTVTPLGDREIVDRLVPQQLNLCLATQCKTSRQRLCHVIDKAKLPRSTTVQEMRNIVRLLKRCDHVNILLFHEAFEDEGALYFMYEHFPCCTLLSQLQDHTWDQLQIVNMTRECCAATAYASSLGLLHMGWTLCHILLPEAAARGGSPTFCKIFGFGLMGLTQVDSPSHEHWAPEALEKFYLQGEHLENFTAKMEGPLRYSCDSWSLGAIVYALIARQPLFSSEEDLLCKRWSFPLAIDDMDPAAKTLVEGFLHYDPDLRLKPERALHHEWIRRRWRPMPGSAETFVKLENFCSAPLAKRLFSRFIVQFLDADHLLKIARSFYCLDTVGNGVIMMKELLNAAKIAGRPDSAAYLVHKWLVRDGAEHVTLNVFAESQAEEVIDGRALRHAFDSLDNDGSQQITAEELFAQLSVFDPALTMQNVVKHIEDAELDLSGNVQDHQIDYSEFVRLFPEHNQRIRALEDRLQSSRDRTKDLSDRFRSTCTEREEWIEGMSDEVKAIKDLSERVRRSEHSMEAANQLRKHFTKVETSLKSPPGHEIVKMTTASTARHSFLKKVGSSKLPQSESYRKGIIGIDTFMLDIALREQWKDLIYEENKMLKNMLHLATKNRFASASENGKAHVAAEDVRQKVERVLARATDQQLEYDAFVQALEQPEVLIHEVSFSGRGLRARHGTAVDRAGQKDGAGGEGGRRPMARFLFSGVRNRSSQQGRGGQEGTNNFVRFLQEVGDRTSAGVRGSVRGSVRDGLSAPP